MNPAHLRHIRAMPKVELHRHLEGSVRFSTLKELFRSHVHNGDLPSALAGERSVDALDQAVRDHFCVDHKIQNLTQFLEKFEHTRLVLCTHQIIDRVTYEACEDAARCGVVILELRYSPVYLAQGKNNKNMTIESIHNAVVAGMRRAMSKYPIRIALIGILDRCSSLEDATEAANFFIANSDAFVGVDLANDEDRFDGLHLKSLFKRCQSAGLAVTIHAGETPNPKAPTNVMIAMQEFGAKRIGHGIHILRDQDVVNQAVHEKTIFEVCPTSNALIGTVESIEKHPLVSMLGQRLKVTLSTDDPGLFLNDMNEECVVAVRDCGMTLVQLWHAQQVAYEASFIPKQETEKLWMEAVHTWKQNDDNLLRHV